jgi:hypothetical protein
VSVSLRPAERLIARPVDWRRQPAIHLYRPNKKIESPFPHPTIAVGSTVACWPHVHSTAASCVRGCSNTASCPRGQPAPRHLDTAAAPSHHPTYPNPSGRLPARFRPFPVAARASSCYLRLSLSTAATPRPSSTMVSTSSDHRATVRALHR